MTRPVFDAAPTFEDWRVLLPDAVRLSCGWGGDESLPTFDERRSIGAVGERRLREFAIGRWHARRALSELGVRTKSLPRLANGAPGWPDGIVGSLSHTVVDGRVYTVAAVAEAGRISALGIDVEAPVRLPVRDWFALLGAERVDQLAGVPMASRAARALELWCGAEAVAKAMTSTRHAREVVERSVQVGTRDGWCRAVVALVAADD